MNKVKSDGVAITSKEIMKVKYERKIDNIRTSYDNSTCKSELKSLKEEYQNIPSEHKKWRDILLWSKLYRFFTMKKSK